jgi:hypothetical protein
MVKLGNWNPTENCFLITISSILDGALVGAGKQEPVTT